MNIFFVCSVYLFLEILVCAKDVKHAGMRSIVCDAAEGLDSAVITTLHTDKTPDELVEGQTVSVLCRLFTTKVEVQ